MITDRSDGGNIVDRFNVALKEVLELVEIQDYIQD